MEVQAGKQLEKILGKFDDDAALGKALNELYSKTYGEDVPVPEYKDQTGREKAYSALEKIHSKITAKPPEEKKAAVTATDDDPLKLGGGDEDPDVDAILAKAGLDPAEVQKQWLGESKLTDAQYAALKKVGYGKKLADTIATGQHARAVLNVQIKQGIKAKAIEAVGGQQAFDNLNLWADANIPKERMDSLNAMVKGNPGVFPEVVRLIQMEHATAVGAGKANPLVTGSSAGAGAQPKTWTEFNALIARAERGDASAKQAIIDTDLAKLT